VPPTVASTGATPTLLIIDATNKLVSIFLHPLYRTNLKTARGV
jgi:hypothetical protein